MDNGYTHICKELFGTCKTVLTLDNHWFGDFKQRLKTFFAKHYFKKIFTHAWVPGEPQLPFVKKLGFNQYNTHTGFYSADIKLFQPSEENSLNYNLIYVGRYLDFKGIFELWNAFIEFKKTAKHPWTLHCVGTGDLWEKRAIHSDIVHHGFLQPAELKKLVDTCDVFVLPSHKEPWGVAAHEMAACGLTLLCYSVFKRW
jgi:glycosyltransferase involved in cell wall biosynthesis